MEYWNKKIILEGIIGEKRGKKERAFKGKLGPIKSPESLFELYKMMLYCRLYEEMVRDLWYHGYIFGEMHMGIGEEAVIASVMAHLNDNDAVAVDHRGTSAFLLRGVDPLSLLLELMGHPDGLCRGLGGHMHLFSKEHLIASSGIVGSSGPAAAGFATAIKKKDNGGLAVAFFGEGAVNQGMMMESMNLASAWELPVLFVCKDNDWAITTISHKVTGGSIVERAKGFGIEAEHVNGLDAAEMLAAVHRAVEYIRKTGRPFLVHADVVHMDGHFLGDPLFRFHVDMTGEFKKIAPDLFKALKSRKGAGIIEKSKVMGQIMESLEKTKKQTKKSKDPVLLLERILKSFPEINEKISPIADKMRKDIGKIRDEALKILKTSDDVSSEDDRPERGEKDYDGGAM